MFNKVFNKKNKGNNETASTAAPERGGACRLLKAVLIAVGVTVFWLGIWQLLYIKIGNQYILPSPKNVAVTLADLVCQKFFWTNTLNSLLTIFRGFLLAQLIGIILAFITTKILLFKMLFSPIMAIVKSTPIASFIILLLVLLGKDVVPETAAFLIVLPTVWENMSSGINSISKDLTEVATVYNFGLGKRLQYLYVPSIMPFFIPALKATFGMAWKAGIAAEVLCSTKDSIGGEIYASKIYLEVSQLFAWTATVIIISICFEKLLMLFVNHFNKKVQRHRKA